MTPHAEKVEFWNRVWEGGADAGRVPCHSLRGELEAFVRDHQLQDSRVLEIGCGAGGLQGLSSRYVGTDISPKCAEYLSPPAEFACCPANALPFEDDAFDLVFSIYVLEHVTDVESVLHEIRRITKPGGLVLLKPAWFCRPWTGRDWFHKPLRDCSVRERILKAGVCVRNRLSVRAAHLACWRIRGLAGNDRLRFRKITPNFDATDVIDADAEVWLDPLDFIRWFRLRGDVCLSHSDFLSRWCRTSEAVVFHVKKPAQRSVEEMCQ